MKPARPAIAAAALATMMLAPAPLAAQADEQIAEAFERGRNPGITPLTRGEKTMCAGYWGSWAEMIVDPPTGEVLAEFPRELQPELAFGISKVWNANRLAEGASQADLEEAIEVGLEDFFTAMAVQDVEATMGYFETLGSCLPPPDESGKGA